MKYFKATLAYILAAALMLSAMFLAPGIETYAVEPSAMGVDVSSWNGNIDWAAAAEQINFAILRISSKLTADSKFTANAAGCIANEIPYGVYHVSSATSEEEALAEAEFVIAALEGYDPQLPVYFDVEYKLHNALTSEQLRTVTRVFCEAVRAAGYEPGLFTYTDLLEEHFSEPYFDTLPKWVSEIDVDVCSYTGNMTMWQYSWSGRVAGISGDVDCNYYYGQLPGTEPECEHLQWSYSFADNAHYLVCDGCGEARSIDSSDGKQFKINSAALELANNINVLYSATIPAGFSDPYMVFEAAGTKTVVTEYALTDNGRYCFSFEGIQPQLMGENICAYLYATLDGMKVSCCVAQYSVRQYCVTQLGRNPSETLKRLLSDLLIYGEKAQLFSGYSTDRLVSAGLELSPSTFTELDVSHYKQLVEGEKNQIVDYTSVSLSLSNSVAIRYRISTNDPSPYTYRVTMDGTIYDYSSEDLTYQDGYYYLDFAEFDATRFGQTASAVILHNGQQVGRTVTYSVNSYVYLNQNSTDEALCNLLRAIYNYGRSAQLVAGR